MPPDPGTVRAYFLATQNRFSWHSRVLDPHPRNRFVTFAQLIPLRYKKEHSSFHGDPFQFFIPFYFGCPNNGRTASLVGRLFAPHASPPHNSSSTHRLLISPPSSHLPTSPRTHRPSPPSPPPTPTARFIYDGSERYPRHAPSRRFGHQTMCGNRNPADAQSHENRRPQPYTHHKQRLGESPSSGQERIWQHGTRIASNYAFVQLHG